MRHEQEPSARHPLRLCRVLQQRHQRRDERQDQGREALEIISRTVLVAAGEGHQQVGDDKGREDQVDKTQAMLSYQGDVRGKGGEHHSASATKRLVAICSSCKKDIWLPASSTGCRPNCTVGATRAISGITEPLISR